MQFRSLAHNYLYVQLNQTTMVTISTNYKLKWQFKNYPQYAITTCKNVINTHRGTIVKKTLNGGSIGWWISGNFIAQSKVNSHVELIKLNYIPF